MTAEETVVTGLVGNCGLCGKARTDLKLHTVINGEPQYLGQCCLKRVQFHLESGA